MTFKCATFDYEVHRLASVGQPSFETQEFPYYCDRTPLTVTFTEAGTYRYTDLAFPNAPGGSSFSRPLPQAASLCGMVASDLPNSPRDSLRSARPDSALASAAWESQVPVFTAGRLVAESSPFSPHPRSVLVSCVVGLAAVGCGGASGDITTPPSPPPPPKAIVRAAPVASGAGQSGIVATTLPLPLRVEVDSDGSSLQGVTVVWHTASGALAPTSQHHRCRRIGHDAMGARYRRCRGDQRHGQRRGRDWFTRDIPCDSHSWARHIDREDSR